LRRPIDIRNKTQLKYAIGLPFNSSPAEDHVYPSGIYLFKDVANPWSIVLSKSSHKMYYYNSESRKSTYDLPLDGRFYADPK